MAGDLFLITDKLKIVNDDVLKTNELKPNSVDLIVTSLPYNLDIKYNSHNDKLTYEQYLEFSKK